MIHKILSISLLLLLPRIILSVRVVFPELDSERKSTDDRSPINTKMNIAGLDLSANKTENINSNPSSLYHVIQDIMEAAPARADIYYDMPRERGDITNTEIVHIKKCCGPNEVLDQWYRCSQRRNIDELIANVTAYDLSEISFQYNSFMCPKKKVNEYVPIVPLNILNNSSIEIEMDDGSKILEDYHCLDVTEIEVNSEDGIHVVTCDSNGKSSFSSSSKRKSTYISRRGLRLPDQMLQS